MTRAEAARLLNNPLRGLRRGKLQLVAGFYLPYRVFDVAVTNGGKRKRMLMAIDSVTARLDPYRIDALPSIGRAPLSEGVTFLEARVPEAVAMENLKERVRREAYLRGFFKVSGFGIEARYMEDLHIPYWAGVYRRGDRVSLEVIDGVRKSFEGEKLREIVAEWLASAQS